LLQRTATDLQKDGWDNDIGYGGIDAAAVKAMDSTMRRKK
jgi:hypothetical protein